MSQQGTIKRYMLEIEKANSGQYPSFREIKDHLYKHGFEISDRTLQRDIEQIRNEFGLELRYNTPKRGYDIDYSKSVNVEAFFRFLEIVNTASLLSETLTESKNSLENISFGSFGGMKGTENLKPILKAIKEKRKIAFEHFNFHKNKKRKYNLKPYLIREYQNRWYVVGIVSGFDDLRTFGIDRIEYLEVTTETFQPDKKINPKELFESIIGVVYSLGEKQEVILSFTPTQGKYVKTLPLHQSQKILADNKNELRISLNIIPNFEFTQQILLHGDTVKVIEPEWLVNEIKARLSRALDQYN
jgi:predicted DNA-binding transcriptional regulator YafY